MSCILKKCAMVARIDCRMLKNFAISLIFRIFFLQYGETPLHMAAKNGCNEAAKLLLSHGAFIEAKANVICFLFYLSSKQLLPSYTMFG